MFSYFSGVLFIFLSCIRSTSLGHCRFKQLFKLNPTNLFLLPKFNQTKLLAGSWNKKSHSDSVTWH